MILLHCSGMRRTTTIARDRMLQELFKYYRLVAEKQVNYYGREIWSGLTRVSLFVIFVFELRARVYMCVYKYTCVPICVTFG